MTHIEIPALGRSGSDRIVRCLAAAVLLLQLFETFLDRGPLAVVLTLAVMVVGLCLTDGNCNAFGLRRTPVQGWLHWCRLALIFGGVILVLSAIYALIAWTTDWNVAVPKAPPEDVMHRAFWFCVYSPVVEEAGFRILLTIALLPWLGARGTIVASGVLFAAVHVLRGNPGPDNMVAGFLLEWAYLRSGTVLVPLAMHTGGNALALASHAVNWYVLPDFL